MSKFRAMIHACIFASGSGTNAENLMRYFKNDTRIKFRHVVTNNPNAGVIARAEALGKTVHIIPNKIFRDNPDAVLDFLKSEKIDFIILAGFLLKIPEAIVAAFPRRMVNVHPSLLPKYGGKGMYGMHVHEAVIRNKEKESGITIHYVNEHYDEGEIIFQAKVQVTDSDTPQTLAEKIHRLEYEHFPKVIEMLINEIEKEKNYSTVS
ncbi:MAG: phosphoribosylglycinamide formyltransferase [Bacteroidia bacterium]|nr:phosphoribosylglycinamide formyltransferase [Bacteroidia bacterium]